MVLVIPPPVAATVIGKLPGGVDPEVVTFNTVEQFGVQEPEENEARVSDGSPETEKEMDWAAPDARFAVTVLATEEPTLTDLLPFVESEKSNADNVEAV